MTFDRLRTDELRGTTQADYLVSLDAPFRILDGDDVFYEENAFPVVELARSLLTWLDDPARGDFEFSSMSFEEVGTVRVRETDAGWTFSSVFDPAASSPPVDWAEVERCVRMFVSGVERDLRALGIDPATTIRR
jgi:hypothetical protein